MAGKPLDWIRRKGLAAWYASDQKWYDKIVECTKEEGVKQTTAPVWYDEASHDQDDVLFKLLKLGMKLFDGLKPEKEEITAVVKPSANTKYYELDYRTAWHLSTVLEV